jgi:hypothetical protein
MPLITRRSSTRAFPRTSVGKTGAIFCHCSSFSQNRLLLMISAPSPQRITTRLTAQESYWVLTLVDLLSGRVQGRTNDRQISFFLNAGEIGAQFTALAASVYQRARDRGLGQEFPTDYFLENIRD